MMEMNMKKHNSNVDEVDMTQVKASLREARRRISLHGAQQSYIRSC